MRSSSCSCADTHTSKGAGSAGSAGFAADLFADGAGSAVLFAHGDLMEVLPLCCLPEFLLPAAPGKVARDSPVPICELSPVLSCGASRFPKEGTWV